jgi:hypothetical protein
MNQTAYPEVISNSGFEVYFFGLAKLRPGPGKAGEFGIWNFGFIWNLGFLWIEK